MVHIPMNPTDKHPLKVSRIDLSHPGPRQLITRLDGLQCQAAEQRDAILRLVGPHRCWRARREVIEARQHEPVLRGQ